MITSDQCVSVTELRNGIKAYLNDLDNSYKIVFVNNKPKAALVSMEFFEKLMKLPRLIELDPNEIDEKMLKEIKKTKKINKSKLNNI